MALGVMYVVFTGIQLMLVLCVDNSDIQDLVDKFMVILVILLKLHYQP